MPICEGPRTSGSSLYTGRGGTGGRSSALLHRPPNLVTHGTESHEHHNRIPVAFHTRSSSSPSGTLLTGRLQFARPTLTVPFAPRTRPRSTGEKRHSLTTRHVGYNLRVIDIRLRQPDMPTHEICE